MRFKDTENKRAIRAFDRDVLATYCEEKGKKPLSYFGLPGARMLDILEWKEFLCRWVAVEIDDDAYSELNFTALEENLCSGLVAIQADIDDVLLGGADDRVEFPFDVFNLDYSGGAVYKGKSGAKRLRAWENLFRRQSKHKHDFLLFLTLNSRERDEGEIDEALKEAQGFLEDHGKNVLAQDVERIIGEGSKRDKFKIYIPVLMAHHASHYLYELSYSPPIRYAGSSKIAMMHFIFTMDQRRGRVTPLLQQALEQIVVSEVYDCRNGEICRSKGGLE